MSRTGTLNPLTEPAAYAGKICLSSPLKTMTLALLLLIGAGLLLYKFPSVPVGLHQDEVAEAYEAYSLLHTGNDRWGYHLPVYFLSWGSGQNVLQAYLTVPVVAVLGLTRVSARFIPLLCNLLLLPLFFYTVRRWYGEDTALLGLLFVIFSPWHIMLSRIGIENSPLPFFMLLGVFTFGCALDKRSAWIIVPSLLPFGLAFYTYGVVVVVIPFLLVLLFFMDVPAILESGRAWLGALLLLCLVSSPVAFFTIKNYVTKRNYGFERWLPFSVPLLPATRLAESKASKHGATILSHNLHFISYGFSERKLFPDAWFSPWFQVPDVLPVQAVVLILAVCGITLIVWRSIRTRRLNEPFLLWLLACCPLLLLVPLNISRAIAAFVPILAIAAVGGMRVWGLSSRRSYKAILAVVFGILFFLPAFHFYREYYGPVYASEAAPSLNPELPEALHHAQQLAASDTPIYVTPQVRLNHVQILFLTQYDPHAFQAIRATLQHPDFGPYRFSRESLANNTGAFVFLIKADDIEAWDNLLHRDEMHPWDDHVSSNELAAWDSLLLPEEIQKRNEDYKLDAALKNKDRDSLFEVFKTYPFSLEKQPLCVAPSDVARFGQFLVGKCASARP